jgi:hypothetical protein
MKRRTVRFDIAVGGHDQVIRTCIVMVDFEVSFSDTVGEVRDGEVVDALSPGK